MTTSLTVQARRAIVERVVDEGLEFRLRQCLCDPSSTPLSFRDVLMDGMEQAIERAIREGT